MKAADLLERLKSHKEFESLESSIEEEKDELASDPKEDNDFKLGVKNAIKRGKILSPKSYEFENEQGDDVSDLFENPTEETPSAAKAILDMFEKKKAEAATKKGGCKKCKPKAPVEDVPCDSEDDSTKA